MIPRFQPHLSFQEWAIGWFTSKPSIKLLEQQFQTYFPFQSVVWLPFARTGIRVFLETLNSPQRKVVASPFNCTALAEGIVGAGAVPFYVDTQSNGFNANEVAFLAALNRPESVAGIPTSLWGTELNYDLYSKATKPLLYDLALGTLQTHFPKLKENDAVLFSTGWGKPLSFMGGGFLCGNNVEAGLAWKEWRDCRLTPAKSVRKQIESLAILLGGSRKIFNLTLRAGQWRGAQGLLGKNESSLWLAEYNRGLSTLCFRLGMKRLGELNKIRLQRKQQVEFYRRNLSGKISDLCLPEGDHLSHFSLRTPRRDSLHYFLKQRGIFTSHKLFSQLLSDIPSFKGDVWGELTYAKKLVDETIHLPLFFSLTEREQSYICDQVIAWSEFEKLRVKTEVAELAWGRA